MKVWILIFVGALVLRIVYRVGREVGRIETLRDARLEQTKQWKREIEEQIFAANDRSVLH